MPMWGGGCSFAVPLALLQTERVPFSEKHHVRTNDFDDHKIGLVNSSGISLTFKAVKNGFHTNAAFCSLSSGKYCFNTVLIG